MKVQVTTDLSDSDRLMIGLMQLQALGVRASHKECRTFLEELIEKGLEPLRTEWDELTQERVAYAKKVMGISE